jgi:hypothetical protein
MTIQSTVEYFKAQAKATGRGDSSVSELVTKGSASCWTCRTWYKQLTGYVGKTAEGRTVFCCSIHCAERAHIGEK